MDSTEANYSATTDDKGKFEFNAPPYDYQIVTLGGTDTVTKEPAMQMVAPQGSASTTATKNVTPLTTMVALTPAADQAALISTIESLGVSSYDVDISATDATTPAATALVQSIQSAVTAVTDTFDTSASTGGQSLSTAVKSNIQREMLAQVATQITGETVANLTDSSTLGTKLGAAASTTATNVSSDSTINGGNTVSVTSTASLGSSVASAVTNVAAAVFSSSTSQGISNTTKTSETTVVTGTVAASIVAETDSTFISDIITNANVTIIPVTNSAPTISGIPGAATAGTAYSFTPTLTDSDTSDTHLWTMVGTLPAGLTFNRANGKISGTPTASGSINVTISVSDGVASSNSLAVNVTIGTTGGGGTGN
jgi:hypothetical protein